MKRLLSIAFLGLTWSCKEGIFKDDDTLSIQREPYTGNQLRIDGYYYMLTDGYLTVYFLYGDGTALYAFTFPEDELQEHEEDYKSTEWQSIVKKTKHGWGLFEVESNIIKYELWYPTGPPLKAYVREGEVLDDTTFVISQSYRVVDGQKTEVKEREETYHFKEFSPKPDSTNGFVR